VKELSFIISFIVGVLCAGVCIYGGATIFLYLIHSIDDFPLLFATVVTSLILYGSLSLALIVFVVIVVEATVSRFS